MMRLRSALPAIALGSTIAVGAAEKPSGGAALGNEARVARYLESIRDQPPLLRAFLGAMPKGADLHSHLTGAVYAESLLQWAAEDGRCVDTKSLAASAAPCDEAAGRPPAAVAMADQSLHSRVIDAWSMRHWRREDESGHDRFFGTFRLAFAGAQGRIGDMVAEVAHRAADGHVSYLELMLTPEGGAAMKLAAEVGWDDDLERLRRKLVDAGLERVVATAREQLDVAQKRKDELLACGTAHADPGCGVEVRFLYQVLRGLPREQVFAQILAGFEAASRDPRFVGLNLVMPEDWLVPMRDFSLHMRMIDHLKKSYPRVHISLHAGELWQGLVPPEGLRFHVRESVEVGHAERIGHGVAVMYERDPLELLRDMARRKILVEICLTSGDVILGVRGRDHPLSAYIAHGVPVALATDDQGVSRSDITQEYMRAVLDQGLGYVRLKRMARAGLEHAFADDVTMARLLKEHDAATAAFEASVIAASARSGVR